MPPLPPGAWGEVGRRIPTSAAALTPTFQRALAQQGLRSLSRVEIALAHLLESRLSLLVGFNALVCFLILAALVTRAVFLGRLLQHEARHALERGLHYVLYKGVFLVAAVRPNSVEMFTWCCWFALMGFFKIFSGVAKDRLETLMSRPDPGARSGSTHRRAIALHVFLLASVGSLTCLCLSMGTYRENRLGLALVLYEPAVVAVEVLGALSRYYLFLAEQWCLRLDQAGELAAAPAAKALWEWCGSLLYHSELFAEVATLGLTLAHYMQVWWLHGLSLQFVDAVLFLNVRAIGAALHRRLAGYLRFLAATRNLREAFPDASREDLRSEPECAVCLQPMRWEPTEGFQATQPGRRSAPKRLPCGHVFHLHCLRSWLEQGGTDNYSCPICRASLSGSDRTDGLQEPEVGGGGSGGSGGRGGGAAKEGESQPTGPPLTRRRAAAAAAAARARAQVEAEAVTPETAWPRPGPGEPGCGEPGRDGNCQGPGPAAQTAREALELARRTQEQPAATRAVRWVG